MANQPSISEVADGAEEVANRIAKPAASSLSKQPVVGDMKAALEKSVTNQPMTTAAIIAVAGFMLGVLWKM